LFQQDRGDHKIAARTGPLCRTPAICLCWIDPNDRVRQPTAIGVVFHQMDKVGSRPTRWPLQPRLSTRYDLETKALHVKIVVPTSFCKVGIKLLL